MSVAQGSPGCADTRRQCVASRLRGGRVSSRHLDIPPLQDAILEDADFAEPFRRIFATLRPRHDNAVLVLGNDPAECPAWAAPQLLQFPAFTPALGIVIAMI